MVNEGKACPICGMNMRNLCREVWECRCGHREISNESKEPERRIEEQKRRIPFWEEKDKMKGRQPTISYKKVTGTGRKRTSIRGG